jgi:hypothetical protein
MRTEIKAAAASWKRASTNVIKLIALRKLATKNIFKSLLCLTQNLLEAVIKNPRYFISLLPP